MMEDILKDEFHFYSQLARPLVLNLPKSKDRILAAAWIKKFRDETVGTEQLRTMYLKLLLFCLQTRRLAGIFADDASNYEVLEDLPDGIDLNDFARNLIKQEQAERAEFIRLEMMGDMEAFPAYTTDCSPDLKEYVAAQDIPNFGVHAYYAISKQPVNKWQRSEKAILPKGIKSAIDTSIAAAATAASECPCAPKSTASAPEVEEVEGAEGSEQPECKKKKEKKIPERRKRRPKKLGASPPTKPIGDVQHPAEERITPTWGTNLLEVKDHTDIGNIDEPTEADKALEEEASRLIEDEDEAESEEDERPKDRDTVASKTKEMLNLMDEFKHDKMDKPKKPSRLSKLGDKSRIQAPKSIKAPKIAVKGMKKGKDKGGYGPKPANLPEEFADWTEEDLKEAGLKWADLMPVEENIDDELQRIEDDEMGGRDEEDEPIEALQFEGFDEMQFDLDAMIREAEADLALDKSVYEEGVEEDEPIVELFNDELDDIQDQMNISRTADEVRSTSPALSAGMPLTTPTRSASPRRVLAPERVYAEEEGDELLRHRQSPLRPPKPPKKRASGIPKRAKKEPTDKDPNISKVFKKAKKLAKDKSDSFSEHEREFEEMDEFERLERDFQDEEGSPRRGRSPVRQPSPAFSPGAAERVHQRARQQEDLLRTPDHEYDQFAEDFAGAGADFGTPPHLPCGTPPPLTEDEEFEMYENMYRQQSPRLQAEPRSPTTGAVLEIPEMNYGADDLDIFTDPRRALDYASPGRPDPYARQPSPPRRTPQQDPRDALGYESPPWQDPHGRQPTPSRQSPQSRQAMIQAQQETLARQVHERARQQEEALLRQGSPEANAIIQDARAAFDDHLYGFETQGNMLDDSPVELAMSPPPPPRSPPRSPTTGAELHVPEFNIQAEDLGIEWPEEEDSDIGILSDEFLDPHTPAPFTQQDLEDEMMDVFDRCGGRGGGPQAQQPPMQGGSPRGSPLSRPPSPMMQPGTPTYPPPSPMLQSRTPPPQPLSRPPSPMRQPCTPSHPPPSPLRQTHTPQPRTPPPPLPPQMPFFPGMSAPITPIRQRPITRPPGYQTPLPRRDEPEPYRSPCAPPVPYGPRERPEVYATPESPIRYDLEVPDFYGRNLENLEMPDFGYLPGDSPQPRTPSGPDDYQPPRSASSTPAPTRRPGRVRAAPREEPAARARPRYAGQSPARPGPGRPRPGQPGGMRARRLFDDGTEEPSSEPCRPCGAGAPEPTREKKKRGRSKGKSKRPRTPSPGDDFEDMEWQFQMEDAANAPCARPNLPEFPFSPGEAQRVEQRAQAQYESLFSPPSPEDDDFEEMERQFQMESGGGAPQVSRQPTPPGAYEDAQRIQDRARQQQESLLLDSPSPSEDEFEQLERQFQEEGGSPCPARQQPQMSPCGAATSVYHERARQQEELLMEPTPPATPRSSRPVPRGPGQQRPVRAPRMDTPTGLVAKRPRRLYDVDEDRRKAAPQPAQALVGPCARTPPQSSLPEAPWSWSTMPGVPGPSRRPDRDYTPPEMDFSPPPPPVMSPKFAPAKKIKKRGKYPSTCRTPPQEGPAEVPWSWSTMPGVPGPSRRPDRDYTPPEMDFSPPPPPVMSPQFAPAKRIKKRGKYPTPPPSISTPAGRTAAPCGGLGTPTPVGDQRVPFGGGGGTPARPDRRLVSRRLFEEPGGIPVLPATESPITYDPWTSPCPGAADIPFVGEPGLDEEEPPEDFPPYEPVLQEGQMYFPDTESPGRLPTRAAIKRRPAEALRDVHHQRISHLTPFGRGVGPKLHRESVNAFRQMDRIPEFESDEEYRRHMAMDAPIELYDQYYDKPPSTYIRDKVPKRPRTCPPREKFRSPKTRTPPPWDKWDESSDLEISGYGDAVDEIYQANLRVPPEQYPPAQGVCPGSRAAVALDDGRFEDPGMARHDAFDAAFQQGTDQLVQHVGDRGLQDIADQADLMFDYEGGLLDVSPPPDEEFNRNYYPDIHQASHALQRSLEAYDLPDDPMTPPRRAQPPRTPPSVPSGSPRTPPPRRPVTVAGPRGAKAPCGGGKGPCGSGATAKRPPPNKQLRETRSSLLRKEKMAKQQKAEKEAQMKVEKAAKAVADKKKKAQARKREKVEAQKRAEVEAREARARAAREVPGERVRPTDYRAPKGTGDVVSKSAQKDRPQELEDDQGVRKARRSLFGGQRSGHPDHRGADSKRISGKKKTGRKGPGDPSRVRAVCDAMAEPLDNGPEFMDELMEHQVDFPGYRQGVVVKGRYKRLRRKSEQSFDQMEDIGEEARSPCRPCGGEEEDEEEDEEDEGGDYQAALQKLGLTDRDVADTFDPRFLDEMEEEEEDMEEPGSPDAIQQIEAHLEDMNAYEQQQDEWWREMASDLNDEELKELGVTRAELNKPTRKGPCAPCGDPQPEAAPSRRADEPRQLSQQQQQMLDQLQEIERRADLLAEGMRTPPQADPSWSWETMEGVPGPSRRPDRDYTPPEMDHSPPPSPVMSPKFAPAKRIKKRGRYPTTSPPSPMLTEFEKIERRVIQREQEERDYFESMARGEIEEPGEQEPSMGEDEELEEFERLEREMADAEGEVCPGRGARAARSPGTRPPGYPLLDESLSEELPGPLTPVETGPTYRSGSPCSWGLPSPTPAEGITYSPPRPQGVLGPAPFPQPARHLPLQTPPRASPRSPCPPSPPSPPPFAPDHLDMELPPMYDEMDEDDRLPPPSPPPYIPTPPSPPLTPERIRQEVTSRAMPQFDPGQRRDVLRRDQRRVIRTPCGMGQVQEEAPLIPHLAGEEPTSEERMARRRRREPEQRRTKKKRRQPQDDVSRHMDQLEQRYDLPPEASPEQDYHILDDSLPEDLASPLRPPISPCATPIRSPLARLPPGSIFGTPPPEPAWYPEHPGYTPPAEIYVPPEDLPIHPDLVDLANYEPPYEVPDEFDQLGDEQAGEEMFFTPPRYPETDEMELDRQAQLLWQPPPYMKLDHWASPGELGLLTPPSVGKGRCGTYTPSKTPPLGLLESPMGFRMDEDMMMSPPGVGGEGPCGQVQDFMERTPPLERVTSLQEMTYRTWHAKGQKAIKPRPQYFGGYGETPQRPIPRWHGRGGARNVIQEVEEPFSPPTPGTPPYQLPEPPSTWSPGLDEFERLERDAEEATCRRRQHIPQAQQDFQERCRRMRVDEMSEEAERLAAMSPNQREFERLEQQVMQEEQGQKVSKRRRKQMDFEEIERRTRLDEMTTESERVQMEYRMPPSPSVGRVPSRRMPSPSRTPPPRPLYEQGYQDEAAALPCTPCGSSHEPEYEEPAFEMPDDFEGPVDFFDDGEQDFLAGYQSPEPLSDSFREEAGIDSPFQIPDLDIDEGLEQRMWHDMARMEPTRPLDYSDSPHLLDQVELDDYDGLPQLSPVCGARNIPGDPAANVLEGMDRIERDYEMRQQYAERETQEIREMFAPSPGPPSPGPDADFLANIYGHHVPEDFRGGARPTCFVLDKRGKRDFKIKLPRKTQQSGDLDEIEEQRVRIRTPEQWRPKKRPTRSGPCGGRPAAAPTPGAIAVRSGPKGRITPSSSATRIAEARKQYKELSKVQRPAAGARPRAPCGGPPAKLNLQSVDEFLQGGQQVQAVPLAAPQITAAEAQKRARDRLRAKRRQGDTGPPARAPRQPPPPPPPQPFTGFMPRAVQMQIPRPPPQMQPTNQLARGRPGGPRGGDRSRQQPPARLMPGARGPPRGAGGCGGATCGGGGAGRPEASRRQPDRTLDDFIRGGPAPGAGRIPAQQEGPRRVVRKTSSVKKIVVKKNWV